MSVRFLTLALAAGLGAVDALAVVRVFFTSSAQPYGLTNPALAFQPTLGQQQDAASYQVAAFPPLEAWDQTPTVNWHVGEFTYIWVRFHEEYNNRKIQGVRVDVDQLTVDLAYYVMDDRNGAHGEKRWEGIYTMPSAPEFRRDPQLLAAIQAIGIVNRGTPVDNWNLYDNVTRTALLCAVRYGSDGLRGIEVVNFPAHPPPYQNIVWETGQANWVPEPAALAVAMLLCAAFRRSRRSGREM